jgi:hypothetical protein
MTHWAEYKGRVAQKQNLIIAKRFKPYTAQIRVVVDVCKTQRDVTRALSYIEQYTSVDNHKIQTKECDEL